MNRTVVKALLTRHEGRRLKPYHDTEGNLTIGIGRNLSVGGLRSFEVDFLFDNDLNDVIEKLTTNVPCFGSLDDTRQHVLIDMCFDLGIGGLLGFRQMLKHVEERDFDAAADEMLSSEWAKQVGERAVELANMMRSNA